MWEVARCIDCRYDLTGNTSGTCPECGLQLEPSLVGNLERIRESVAQHWVMTLVICVVLAVAWVGVAISAGQTNLHPIVLVPFAVPLLQWSPGLLIFVGPDTVQTRNWRLLWLSTSGWLLWVGPLTAVLCLVVFESLASAGLGSLTGLVLWAALTERKARRVGMSLRRGDGPYLLLFVALPYLLFLLFLAAVLFYWWTSKK